MRKLLLFFFSLSSFQIIAQNDEISDLFNDAKLLMEEKQYEAAIPVWKKAVTLDPENANFKYKLGFCYYHMHLHGERIKSLRYLKQASSNITKNYDILSPNEKQAPIEVYYYLAKALHIDYQFDKAIETYDKFIEIAPKKHRLIPEAERGIQTSQYGKQAVRDSVPVIIRNLGKNINTRFYEHSPVLSLDEEAIYFTSRRLRSDSGNSKYTDQAGKYHEDVYVAYKDKNGEWMKPELLPFSRRNNHDASISLSADGRTLYVYHDDDGHGALYESKLIDGNWSQPVLMGSDINTKAHETHLTISADGRRLYFTSDRKGGEGGMDIWRCVKLPNGEWSLAQNLGPTINTKYDDNAPFIHPDGRTLYFTSRGHKGIGGYDIFSSVIQDDGTWSEPKNFGYPINTPDDEEVFSTSPDGKRGYYSSSQKGGNGEGDIFQVEIVEAEEVPLTLVKGKINIPEGTPFPKGIRIIMTDNETGEFIAESRPLARNGSFVFIIPPGKNYNLSYEINGKEFYNENTYVPVGSEYKEIKKELLLDPLKIEKKEDGSVVVEGGDGNEPKNLEDAPIWRIKYYNNDSKGISSGQTIVYLGQDRKEVLYEELIDQNGYFKYHDLTDDGEEYIFKINNLRDKDLCYDGEVVLIGHSNNKKYNLLADGSCIFAEPGEYKAILAHENHNGLINKKLEAIYYDKAGKELFRSSVRQNGMFGYYHLDNADDYIIELTDDAEEFCHKGEITLFRKDKDIKLYHHKDCKFTTKEPEDKSKDPVNKGNTDPKDSDGNQTDPKDGSDDNGNSVSDGNEQDPKDTKVEMGTPIKKSQFEQNFGYNKYKIVTSSSDFKRFVNEAVDSYKGNKDLPITIQSGASRVPTRTFKNNHELAKSRANDAKTIVIAELKAKGVKESDIRFIDITYLVQGPKYTGDYKSESKYKPFQYVKIWLNK